MSDTGNIPAALVEAAAHELHEHYGAIGSDFTDRELLWRSTARFVLAAAFAECEVTEQWGVLHADGSEGAYIAHTLARAERFLAIANERGPLDPPSRESVIKVRTQSTVADGSVLTGPWRVVVTPAQEGGDG